MIRTSSIELSPLNRNDLTDFMAWAGDPLVTSSLTWTHYSNVDDARTFLEKVAETHPWLMAIRVADRAVGSISLTPGSGRASCRAELGYVIARSYWGKGFATSAARVALERGFRELGVSRIEAVVNPGNQSSCKVAQAAGMTLEGLLKNYVLHRGELQDRYIYAALSN